MLNNKKIKNKYVRKQIRINVREIKRNIFKDLKSKTNIDRINEFNKNYLTKEIDSRIVTASICSGVGASEESMKQLGFNEQTHRNLFMCEWDDKVSDVYKRNFKSENYFKDFYDVDWCLIEKKHIHILFISTPCVEFSMASGVRRGLDSEKGQLYIDVLKQARILNPDKIINENVSSILSAGRHYSLIEDLYGIQKELNYIPNDKQLEKNNWILLEFEKNKYVYKSHFNPKLTIGRTFKIIEEILINEFADYNIHISNLNTKDFNYPQNRNRFFLIMIKKELDLGFIFPVKQELTVKLSDLLEDEVSKSLIINDREIIVYPPKELKNNKQLDLYGEVKNKDGKRSNHQASRNIINPIISPCLTTAGHTKIFHKNKVRKLSPTEQKRLHGFSEEYVLPIEKISLCNHIMGNTLSPVVMKELIRGVLFMHTTEEIDSKQSNNTNYTPNYTKAS